MILKLNYFFLVICVWTRRFMFIIQYKFVVSVCWYTFEGHIYAQIVWYDILNMYYFVFKTHNNI